MMQEHFQRSEKRFLNFCRTQMIKEFREEYKKNLDKYLPKDSTARAIFDIGEKSTDITIKESAQRVL